MFLSVCLLDKNLWMLYILFDFYITFSKSQTWFVRTAPSLTKFPFKIFDKWSHTMSTGLMIGAALEINRRWFTCRNNPRRVSLHRRPVQETLTKCICGIGTCHSQFNLSWHTLVLLWLWPSNDHLWTYVGVAPTLGRRPRGGFNALVLFPAFSNNCWPSFTNQDGDTYEGFCSCWWWFTLTASGAGGHGVNVFDVVSYSCACWWSFPEARPGWWWWPVE